VVTVVLENDGGDKCDQSCKRFRSITQSQAVKKHPTYKQIREASWIGHILRGNCLLKHTMKGKIEGRLEVTVRRGIRRKQLLDDLKKTREHWELKEKSPDGTLWRTRFGRNSPDLS
jgi:hypothetical protein